MAHPALEKPLLDCAQPELSGAFATTLWTVVLSASASDPVKASQALEQLCAKYWYPIYAFVRWRRGFEHHQAQDLTQAFFKHLLEKEALKSVAKERGRFRSFLLAALCHFLKDELNRQMAAKRGGGKQFVSWDGLTAEEKFNHEPIGVWPPEELFDRAWAFALFEQACGQLERLYRRRGRLELFQELKPFLTESPADGVNDQAAARLAMRSETLKVALHRFRRELGECLRAEIACTVAQPEEAKDELRFLLSVVGR